jgi:hypothetical protein
LRGGPRGFNPGFTCPDLLRNQLGSRSSFAYGTLTLYGRIFHIRSATRAICNSPAALRSDLALALQPRPRNARRLPRGIRFGLYPLSLATTGGIETFFLFLRVLRCIISPGSLLAPYVFRYGWRAITPAGFPHSEIRASKPACGSTRLIAACHVLRRLPVPRHPPYALTILMVLDFTLCSFQRPAAFALAGVKLQGPQKALKTEQQLLDSEDGDNPPP